jgi:hypothetical protein
MPHVIDTGLLKRSLLFCRFAAAAYAKTDPRNTPGLSADKLPWYKRLPLGNIYNPTDTQALVCQWNNDIVVAFRGTERNFRDWRTDARGFLVPLHGGSGEVHNGFLDAMDFIYPNIMSSVSQRLQGSNCRIFVTGHSLGGALAMLFANRFVNDAHHDNVSLAEVFTYGSPRVGDPDFVAAYRRSAAGNCTFQWVDKEDPVTRVAPFSLNYRHTIQRQLYVDADGWVRHTDIDATVASGKDEGNLFDSVLGLIQRLKIVAGLDGTSHSLEQSYLPQILRATSKSAGH